MENLDHFIEIYRQSKKENTALAFEVKKVRDLTLVKLFRGFYLVIACDSDGAIGSKPHDVVKCSNYVLGRFAARVPLMEILCAGAVPIMIVDALAVEMNPTGKEIIAGIRDEAYAAGISSGEMITGSTEDNVPTTQTGVGVVAIGMVHENDLKPGKAVAGDIVVAIGIPKSGPDNEIKLLDPEIILMHNLLTIIKLNYIHDIIPVGSKGMAYEAQNLAESANIKFFKSHDVKLNLTKSAGPSTCVLASLPDSELSHLKKVTPHPIHVIGRLE